VIIISDLSYYVDAAFVFSPSHTGTIHIIIRGIDIFFEQCGKDAFCSNCGTAKWIKVAAPFLSMR
jgi:hypothetical protein